MIINTLKTLDSVPSPALGLLPAIHDASVEDVPLVGSNASLPNASDARGRVFRNQTNASIVLPATSRWPARSLEPGATFGSDGRLFYKVRNKLGTTSFYPESFERTVYNFSFTRKSFPPGGVFELNRLFYFRLIANTSTAVWSVIFEVGMRTDQVLPKSEYTIDATLVQGASMVTVPVNRAVDIVQMMVVSGSGIPEGLDGTTKVLWVDVADGKVYLTKPATQSGVKSLKFTAPVGPNLGDYVWLPPMLEESVVLTEMKSMNPLGILLKNYGDKNGIATRNEYGFEAYAKLYDKAISCPMESLPTGADFIMRVRIGQFDTENSVSDPRGYAAYLIRDVKDPDDPA